MFRCDFYDFFESCLNIDKVEFILRNFIVFFVLGIGLIVGKVICIICILKVLILFLILYVDKDSLKLLGIIEVSILVFYGDEKV